MDKFKEYVEIAQERSKQNIIRFIKGVYGVDECVIEHLWEVPVIAPYEGDSIVQTTLSTKSEDEILDIVDEFIASELGDYDGCFIPFDKMASEFSQSEIDEWHSKIENEEISEDYNAIIVYNEKELKKQYKELISENDRMGKKKSPEELEEMLIQYITAVISHERCHLNASYLINEIRNSEHVSEIINGAEISSWEYDDMVVGENKERVDAADYGDRNEILVDTLSEMTNCYEEGDSIQDCLYKVVKKRNGKSLYKDLDDREVMSMYALFPEELTEWATFGAYDEERKNKLKEKIIQVCGREAPLSFDKLSKKITDYCASMEKDALSEKQIEMLEMIGVKNLRRVDKQEMKQVAMSDKAMDTLAESADDIKAFMQNTQKENDTQEK